MWGILNLTAEEKKIRMIHKKYIKYIIILLLLISAVILVRIALFSVHEKYEKPITVEETELQIE